VLGLLALVLLSRAFALVHLALEPHTVCVQHDRLVHGEHVHGDEANGVRVATESEEEGHDEHCTAAFLFHPPPCEPSSAEPGVRLALVRGTKGTPSREVRRASAIPLYLLAPKTSPPVEG
jgi:hypothetical protein